MEPDTQNKNVLAWSSVVTSVLEAYIDLEDDDVGLYCLEFLSDESSIRD